MKLWINACEVSGDVQAGALLNQIRTAYSDLEVIGMGGERLAAAGQSNFFHINELSVMGVTEILSFLPKILNLLKQIKLALMEHKPDYILLVDSGEFNFRVAKIAKKLGIKVYYFIPPKVWAWRRYRIHFLKKYVDKILCILPFEVDFYRKHGVSVQYIENPLVQLLAPYLKEEQKTVPYRVALMPGSRKAEVNTLLPLFANMSAQIQEKFPEATFYIIQAPHFSSSYLAALWEKEPMAPDICFVQPKERYAFLRTCHLCVAASGTATLETGLLQLPTIIGYKVAFFSYFIAKLFVKVKYIGLVNLILNKEVFPEFVQYEVKSTSLAQKVETWFSKKDKVDEIKKDLVTLSQVMIVSDNNLRIFDESNVLK